ncbi:MAG: hypothetical protein KA313_07240 [Pseudarcicella sp.]|jgi:hypothetical protein|nr:hypothetical protein [Pseudarcicella sp.]
MDKKLKYKYLGKDDASGNSPETTHTVAINKVKKTIPRKLIILKFNKERAFLSDNFI